MYPVLWFLFQQLKKLQLFNFLYEDKGHVIVTSCQWLSTILFFSKIKHCF